MLIKSSIFYKNCNYSYTINFGITLKTSPSGWRITQDLIHSHPTIREEGGFAASRQREGAVDLKI
jgi:hypothetical protein